MLDRLHGHRIDHLLMKLRMTLGRRQAILRKQMRIVQVHRLVAAIAGGIQVHHFEVFAHRAGTEALLFCPRSI